jgi:hypothetical protein
MNALLALTPCVVTASLTALLASRKGRDGFLYFLLSFLWSFGFAFTLVVAAVLGLLGVVLGGLAVGAKSAPLLLAGLGGWAAALLCGVLYLFPLLMVLVLPSKAASPAPARPASGRRPKARRAH